MVDTPSSQPHTLKYDAVRPPQDKAIIRSALEVAYKDNKALAEKAEFLEKVVQVSTCS